MTTVVLLGTLDTKGPECAFVRERLLDHGCQIVVAVGNRSQQHRQTAHVIGVLVLFLSLCWSAAVLWRQWRRLRETE